MSRCVQSTRARRREHTIGTSVAMIPHHPQRARSSRIAPKTGG